ncbi:MAG: hypothetical protein FWH46_05440 [Methanimicrococcus sp.]|nr:hypothetical protein [Methanimicrococcus sp.]
MKIVFITQTGDAFLNRFTAKNKDGYFVSDEEIKKAIQRLGEFEDAYEDLMNRQVQIPKELESMRIEGKDKTVRYKETMAQKLINNSIMLFFEEHGLK